MSRLVLIAILYRHFILHLKNDVQRTSKGSTCRLSVPLLPLAGASCQNDLANHLATLPCRFKHSDLIR